MIVFVQIYLYNMFKNIHSFLFTWQPIVGYLLPCPASGIVVVSKCADIWLIISSPQFSLDTEVFLDWVLTETFCQDILHAFL